MIDIGKRYVVVGKTGSGKTYLIKKLILNTTVLPVLIFDSKIDKNFDDFSQFRLVSVVDNYEDAIRSITKNAVILYRPVPFELMNVEDTIDKVFEFVFENLNGCLVVVDEVYSINPNAQNIPRGYFSLITRGRGKNISLISGMQRPKFVSRFVLTEAEEFYIFRLSDIEDRQRLYDIIQDYEIINTIPEKYHYFHYSIETDNLELREPISISQKDYEVFEEKIFSFIKKRGILI